MKIKQLHNWNISNEKARSLQTSLAKKISFTALKKPPELIAGLDCSPSRDGRRIFAAIVVLKLPCFEIVEIADASASALFPYIPGLLSFREAPVCIKAAEKLKTTPDIFLIDGQGIAHPRRLGLASHLGLFFNKPTIGCAKSRLIGSFEQPGKEKGSYTDLTDKGWLIGAAVRTRTNVKPLFISVGNKCLLDDAIKITLACAPKYRLCEPARLAHKTVIQLRLKT